MKITCNDTLSVSVHRVLTRDLNEHQTVFGGRILEIVDSAASIPAMKVARSTVVTASLDHIHFIRPFHLQDSMCMEAYVSGIGHRSIEVFVKIVGENLMTGERFLGFTCFMTFVVEDPHKSVSYDEVVAENDEQHTVIADYLQRKQARTTARKADSSFIKSISTKKPWKTSQK